MSNEGQFVDRSPKVNPAGISFEKEQTTVKQCLTFPEKCLNFNGLKENRKEENFPEHAISGNNYCGIYTQVRSLLKTEPKSQFLDFLNELKATKYDSYWNKRLGKTRDFTQALPPDLDTENYCFGIKTISGENIGELFKTPLTEEVSGEEKHYSNEFPSDENELAINTVRKKRYDVTGKCTKNCLNWSYDSTYNDIQRIFLEKNKYKLGKPLMPNNNIEKLPNGFRFGKQTSRDEYETAGLIQSHPLSDNKIKLIEALKEINSIRTILSSRHPKFPHLDFIATLQYREKECTCLDLKSLHEVCLLFKIKITYQKLKQICEAMNIIDDKNFIDYNKFVRTICSKFQFPKLTDVEDVPETKLKTKTEYQENYNSLMDTLRGPKAKKLTEKSLSGDTSTDELISPTIYTQYGVDYCDFIKPRTRETIKEFFNNIGTEIPNDKFEMIWKIAMKHYNEYDAIEHNDKKEEKVSLYLFKDILKKEMPNVFTTF